MKGHGTNTDKKRVRAGLTPKSSRPGSKNARKERHTSGKSHLSSAVEEPDASFSYKSADDSSILNIIDTIRRGISYSTFSKIAEYTPFSLSEWATFLQLSERTIQRNQKERKAFHPVQSERIIELTMLYKYGVEVFGSQDYFNTWLGTRSVSLGGRVPKELLDTKFGIGMLRDELGRIEYGILS